MARDGPVGFWVYIMANRRNGAIYTGHTDNLWQRVQQHRNGSLGGFTKQYGCKTLGSGPIKGIHTVVAI